MTPTARPTALPESCTAAIISMAAMDDQIAGNGNDDVLLGAAGNDEVHGDDPRTPGEHHGDDRLDGGDGQDELWGEGADDALSGGAGDDYLDGDSLTLDTRHHGEDTLDGGDGNDDLIGGAGADHRLFGGQGDDHLAADDIPPSRFPRRRTATISSMAAKARTRCVAAAAGAPWSAPAAPTS